MSRDDSNIADEGTRGGREILHGEKLAAADTETMWGWGTPAGRQRLARRARLIAEAALLGPRVRALELGCGTGLFTEAFYRTGADVTAIDISPDLIRVARERLAAAPNVQFILGAFESAGVEAPFDAIVGSSVLHHLDVHVALARCRELLRPGGRLAFAEPNMLNPQVFLERTFRFMPPFSHYTSPDETAFVRFTLRRLLIRAGLVNVRITPFDFLHPATPPAFIPAVTAAGRIAERLPIVREISGSLLISCQRPA